jgi:AcrR family transcriptional regulator
VSADVVSADVVSADVVSAETVRDCRPLRADAARNRERILEAAIEVFAERGLEATPDDVAHRAGVGVGTVYRRFPDKEALVEALFEEAVNGIVELALRAGTITDSWDGLVWFLEKASERQAEDLGLRDVTMHCMYGRERISRARERIVRAVNRLVERAQRDGHLRADIVPADVPIIELMVNSVATTTGRVAPDLWRRYLAIVLDGLSAHGPSLSTLPEAPTHEGVEQALICRRG